MEDGAKAAGRPEICTHQKIIPGISRGTHCSAVGYRLPYPRRQTTLLYFTLVTWLSAAILITARLELRGRNRLRQRRAEAREGAQDSRQGWYYIA